MNTLYDDPLYIVSFLPDSNVYKVTITDNGTGEYVTVNIDDETLKIVQVNSEQTIYKDKNAEDKFLEMVYNMFLNGKLVASENNNENQEGGMTFESQAPYGRCPSCNAANASDKSYQGNYCDDCYGDIKDKEYAEKHKYGDCSECGIALKSSEVSSGMCTECKNKKQAKKTNCKYCRKEIDASDSNKICLECEYETWSWHCTICGDALTQVEYDMDTGQCAECREKTGYTPEPAPDYGNGRCPVCNVALKSGQTYCSDECKNYAAGIYD